MASLQRTAMRAMQPGTPQRETLLGVFRCILLQRVLPKVALAISPVNLRLSANQNGVWD